jgi:uncharacterized protein HemY
MGAIPSADENRGKEVLGMNAKEIQILGMALDSLMELKAYDKVKEITKVMASRPGKGEQENQDPEDGGN